MKVRRWAALPFGALLAAVPFVVGTIGGYGLGTACALAVVLALGFQVTYGMAGMLSLAQAPIMGVGAYAIAILTAEHGWSFWSALPVAIVAAGVAGALTGLCALRVRGDVLALVTLGVGEILQAVFLRSSFTGGYQGIPGVPAPSLGGHDLLDRGIYGLALVAVVAVLVATAAILRSPAGRAMTALRDDEIAARAFAVPVGRLRVVAFAVGAAVAGTAGALYAAQNAFVSSVSFGLAQSVTIVLVVLIAGPAKLQRTVVAAVLFTLITNRFVGYGAVSEGLTGALILAVVALRLGALDALTRPVSRRFSRDESERGELSHDGPVPGPRASAPVTRGEVPIDAGAVLRLDHAARSFGGVHAVVDLELEVRPGETVGVIGPNGAGKTTIVNLLTGTIRADRGTVRVDGAEVRSSDDAARRGVVRTFQNLRLFDGMSVVDNVLVGAERTDRRSVVSALVAAGSRRGRTTRRHARRVLGELGIDDLRDRPVTSLSHGQRRRVELARALAARPRYLVLDEPAAGLDPAAVRGLAGILARQDLSQCGVVLVEHDTELVRLVCDRVVGVVKGSVVAEGALGEVLAADGLSVIVGEGV